MAQTRGAGRIAYTILKIQSSRNGQLSGEIHRAGMDP